MSTFGCTVVEIDSVENHPNADRLSIVRIGGFNCISAKLEDGAHRYAAGDFVVYVPEASVLPEWMLRQMDFWKDDKGTLAGSNGDRVKAIKLRGIVSQGVLYQLERKLGAWVLNAVNDTVRETVELGQNVTELLGVTKYEPPIPTNMAGEVASLFGKTVKFDVENHQRYPNVFQEGEPVVATEKLHGCVHKDTLVMLPNGEEVPISTILNENYNYVLSYDIAKKEYISRPITGKMCRPNKDKKQWVKLTMENNRSIILTADHPVYSRDRQSWVEAINVEPGEDIESPIQ